MVLPAGSMPPSAAKSPASRIRVTTRDLRKLHSIKGSLELDPSTVRAAEVLLQAAQGRNDEEIANSLEVAPTTVKATIERWLEVGL